MTCSTVSLLPNFRLRKRTSSPSSGVSHFHLIASRMTSRSRFDATKNQKVPAGIEPACVGFANLCLTTWPRHRTWSAVQSRGAPTSSLFVFERREDLELVRGRLLLELTMELPRKRPADERRERTPMNDVP